MEQSSLADALPAWENQLDVKEYRETLQKMRNPVLQNRWLQHLFRMQLMRQFDTHGRSGEEERGIALEGAIQACRMAFACNDLLVPILRTESLWGVPLPTVLPNLGVSAMNTMKDIVAEVKPPRKWGAPCAWE